MRKLFGNDKYQYLIDSCLLWNLNIKNQIVKAKKPPFVKDGFPVLIEMFKLILASFYYVFVCFFRGFLYHHKLYYCIHIMSPNT